MASRKRISESNDELIDSLVDDFQRDDDPSEADSSVLSSVLPIVRSSHVRANAPRAEVAGINERERASTTRNDSKPPKDMDALTVDTGRPIDTFYIYPTEPQAISHRQRRSYKSGNRSVSSGGSGSVVERATGSVGGILETLGLGVDGNEEDDDRTLTELSKASSSLGQSRQKQHRRTTRSGTSGSSNQTGPQVHLRAFIVLLFLFSILYGAFQWITMLQSNNKISRLSLRKSSKIKKKYKAFEEGEDRPLPDSMVGKMNGGEPGGLAKSLVLVPKKDDNKDKPKLYLERNEVETSLEKDAVKLLDQDEVKPDLNKEDAPVDTLEKMDKADPDKGMSLSVQSGLSGIYTKDPTRKDIPFLWYIPRSGGGMVKNILSNCKDLTVASEVGTTPKKEANNVPKLEIVTVGEHKYINVDTTTIAGISEAKALGLAGSGLAELVVSPRLQAASGLFSSSHHGRTFSMIRHPIERAVSMFYFLKKHKVAAILDLSLEDYCKSPHVENNWMVRMLTDQMAGEIGEPELELAKQVLKEKVLIGLLEQKEESMRRFEFYFGWKYTENAQKQTACRTRFLVGDYRTNESAKGKVKEGSQAWSLLMWQNKLDMKLYKYATLLFLQQGTELFADMP